MIVTGDKKSITTQFSLPPGIPSEQVLRELLRLAFEEYRWFKPVRYGLFSFNGRLPTDSLDYQRLLDHYASKRAVTVLDRTDDAFFMLFPSKSDEEYPYTGKLTWCAPVKHAKKPAWQATYREQVATVMRLFNAPLATAALYADHQSKTRRVVPEEVGQRYTFTVRDYSEGLPGLFWHNFYGPPFLRLFGERLDSLPTESLHRLGPDLAVVQPYTLPTEAGSESARERERHFIQLLGPECFYDFEHHRKPTLLPVLDEADGRRPDES